MQSYPGYGEQDRLFLPPDKGSFPTSGITFTSGVWNVRDRAGSSGIGIGVQSSSATTMWIHRLNDYDSSGNRVYSPIFLDDKTRTRVIFDAVYSTPDTSAVYSSATNWGHILL